MVEQLDEIIGYSSLSGIDKVKYAVALKAYLDGINKDVLEDMDIFEVKKHHFKKDAYSTVFTYKTGNTTIITIKFKKSMMLGIK